jgi:hypothetical protein
MSAHLIIPLTISLAVYTTSDVKTNTSTLEEALLTKGNALARGVAASMAQVLDPAVDHDARGMGHRVRGAVFNKIGTTEVL